MNDLEHQESHDHLQSENQPSGREPPAHIERHNGQGYQTRSMRFYNSNLLTFRDTHSPSCFMAAIPVGGCVIPGKATFWPDGNWIVYYAGFDREMEHRGHFSILHETRDMIWVRASRGEIPTGYRPVRAGKSAEGYELYHAAVRWAGLRVPGRVNVEEGCAVITWGGQQFSFVDNYWILCWRSDAEPYEIDEVSFWCVHLRRAVLSGVYFVRRENEHFSSDGESDGDEDDLTDNRDEIFIAADGDMVFFT